MLWINSGIVFYILTFSFNFQSNNKTIIFKFIFRLQFAILTKKNQSRIDSKFIELVSLKSCLPSQSQDLSGRSWTAPFDYQPNRMLLPKRLLRSDHRSFATLIQWTFLKLCMWHMNNHQPQGDTPGPQADYCYRILESV